ncbi:MAG: hypothetical protein AAF715_03985 [Myxococcota bacterium]
MTVRQTIGPWEVLRRLERRGGARPGVAPVRGRSFLVRRRSGGTSARELHVVDPRPSDARTLRRRVERFATLDHSALAQVVDVFVADARVAIVLRHEDGVALDALERSVDRDRHRLSEVAVFYVAARLASALHRAHEPPPDTDAAGEAWIHGVLGRDDVMVAWDGGVRVLGLCPGLDTVRPSTMPATSRFEVAPEVRRGEAATPAADAFSIAAIVNSLLGGPIAIPSVDEMTPPPGDGNDDDGAPLPAAVARALEAALDPEPEARPSCAALERCFSALTSVAEGRAALREHLELHQALSGLWSVASPDPWRAAEEPLPLSKRTNDFGPVLAELEELDAIESRRPPPLPPATMPSASPDSGSTSTPPASQGAPPPAEVPLVVTPDREKFATTLVSASSSPPSAEAPEVHEDEGEGVVGSAAAPADGASVAPAATDEAPPATLRDDVSSPLPPPSSADPGAKEQGARSSEAHDEESPPPPSSSSGTSRWLAPAVLAGAVVGVALWAGNRRTAADVDAAGAKRRVTSATTAPLTPDDGPAGPRTAGASATPLSAAAAVPRTPEPSARTVATAVVPAPSASATAASDPGLDALTPWVADHRASDAARALPYDRGLLLVRSATETGVAVFGKTVGKTNEAAVVPCLPFDADFFPAKSVHVRLTDGDLAWRSEGRSVLVPCRELTVVRVDADAPEPPYTLDHNR